MKALVFGRTGQVARELAVLGPARGWTLETLGREAVDLTDAGRVMAAVKGADCDAVLNAAAYTAVDQAESERDAAFAVNAYAPRAMARAARERGLPFVHVSTDFVFDGAAHSPYAEDAPTGPLNVYGESKLAGERLVEDTGAVHAILRTSWVFSPHGRNFVKTMLRLGGGRDELRVVEDQRGKPTPASAVAEAMLAAARVLVTAPENGGVYHVAGDEETSWAGLARATIAAAGLAARVVGIPASAYPTPARRPAYSVLDTDKARRTLGLAPASWREAVAATVAALRHSA